MLNIFKLFGTIAINNSDANSSIDDTTDKAHGAASSIENAFKKIGTAVVTYFAADKIKDFGMAAAETAAEVSAEQSAFEQIMGDYAQSAEEKLKSLADNVKMMPSRLTPYMTSITAKFKGLGYGVEDATDLAKRGLTVAADAAAFWDKSLNDAMGGLNSFINGSYEGGEAIGLFANETQLAAYAVSQGIVSQTKDWSNLEEAVKQATRLQYAEDMYMLSGATGQAAKEADQYANIQGNLTEKWRQFKAQIGEPILQNVVVPGMAFLSNGVDLASKKFAQAGPYIEKFKNYAVAAKDKAVELGTYAKDTFNPVLERVSDLFQRGQEKLRPLIDAFGNYVGSGRLAEDATNGVKTAIELAASAVNLLLDVVDGVIGGFQRMHTWGQQNQTILTVLAVIFGGLTTAILAYNAAKIAKRALDVAETVYLYALIGAETAYSVATGAAAGVTTAFGAAVAFLTSPVTLAILAITALIAIGVALYKNWDVIKEKATELWTSITERFTAIKDSVSEKMEGLKNTVSEKLTPVKETFQSVMQAVNDTVKEKLQNMSAAYREHGGGIQGIAAAAMEGIKGYYTAGYSFLNNLSGGKLDEMRQIVSERFEGVKSKMSSSMSEAWSTVTGKLEDIKLSFSTKLNAAKSTATSIFEAIRKTINDKIEAAKNIVRNGVEKLKNFFNFKWELPKIKLPHFSISGKFSLSPPSAPHFGIEWYKKGAVMMEPTIFGYNPATGKTMAGGEAGPEAVAPISTLQEYVSEAVSGKNAEIIAVLNLILQAVYSLDEGIGEKLYNAMLGMKFQINEREFGRLVRAV